MKTLYSYFSMLGFMLLYMVLGACTDEVDYSPADVPGHVQAYFPNNMASKVEMDRKGNSFTVEVSRIDARTETTIELTSEDKSGKFNIPSQVTFKAGESVAPIVITYNYSEENFPFDEYFPITLTLADKEFDTAYAGITYSFVVGVPSPFKKIGYAVYKDSEYFGVPVRVALYQKDLEGQENIYRIDNPYWAALQIYGPTGPIMGADSYDEFLEFKVLKVGDVVSNITISKPNLIYFKSMRMGIMDMRYGSIPMTLDHPSEYGSAHSQGLWLYSKVLEYNPDGSLAAIQLAPMYWIEGVGGINRSQKDEQITIAFNGHIIRDYDLSVKCSKINLDLTGNSSILGSVSLGADIAYVKATVVKKTEIEKAVQGLTDGTIEAERITESGELEVRFNQSGKLALVVVGFDQQDKAQASAYAEFKFSKGGDPYEDLVRGKTIDDYVGEWKVTAYTRDFSLIPFKLSGYSLEKKDDTTLLFRGMLQHGGDDSVEMKYDPSTGFVHLKTYQRMATFTDPQSKAPVDPVHFIFCEADGKEVYEGEIVGGITEEGTILFVNNPSNLHQVTYMIVIGKDNADGYTYKYGYYIGYEWWPDLSVPIGRAAMTWENSNPNLKFIKQALKNPLEEKSIEFVQR